MNCGGFWAAAGWPRCATAGTPDCAALSRSSCCIRRSALTATTVGASKQRHAQPQAEPPAHRGGTRQRRPRRHAIHRDGAAVRPDIGRRVDARGPLPQGQVRWILNDVLSALSAAHAAGILHRDIKPANILFTNSGDVKVADFGIAKSAGAPATMTGQIVGTMAYLSPDRLAGRPATVADDLYAVGGGRLRGAVRAQAVPAGEPARLGARHCRGHTAAAGAAAPRCGTGAGRDDRPGDGARTAVAFSERRGNARRVIWCTAAEFGATTDAGAGSAAAACDDHGRRHAGLS